MHTTGVCTHMHVHMHIIYTQMYTHAHTYHTHKNAHMHVYTHMCTYIICTCSHKCTHSYTRMHINADICAHTQMHAHACTPHRHTSAHIHHKHIHSSQRAWWLSIWFHLKSSKKHTSRRVCGEIFWKDKLRRWGLSAKWYPLAVTEMSRSKRKTAVLWLQEVSSLLLPRLPSFTDTGAQLFQPSSDNERPVLLQESSRPFRTGWEGGSIQPPGVRTDFSVLPESTDTHCWTTQHAPCKTF